MEDSDEDKEQISFRDLKLKWTDFLRFLTNKNLRIHDNLANATPYSLDGNILTVQLPPDIDADDLRSQTDECEKLLNEFYETELKIELLNSKNFNKEQAEERKENLSKDEPPIVKAILEELNAREIR